MEESDMVMADRWFETLELGGTKGILVNVPPPLGVKKQIPGPDVEMTRIGELNLGFMQNDALAVYNV